MSKKGEIVGFKATIDRLYADKTHLEARLRTSEEHRHRLQTELGSKTVYKKVLSQEDRAHVFRLVGAASVCWSDIEYAGDFDEEKAKLLAEDFCDYLVGVKRVDGNG